MTKGELLFEIVLVFVYIDLSVWSAHKPRNVKRFTASVRNHEMLLASYDIRQHKSHSLLVRSVTHGQGSLASIFDEKWVPFSSFFDAGSVRQTFMLYFSRRFSTRGSIRQTFMLIPHRRIQTKGNQCLSTVMPSRYATIVD